MNIATQFKSLPRGTQRLMGLGAVFGLVVALPLFIWAVVTQNFNVGEKAQTGGRVEVGTEGAPYIGPLTAPITIVEFGDFECPFCKSFHDQTLTPLLEAYPNQIRFVFRNFPITELHPNAEIAAEAALCANEQGKFWQMSDLLFANQGNLGIDSLKALAASLELSPPQFNLCLDTLKYSTTIQQDITDGTTYQVTGTPYFFINGIPLPGAYPLSSFQEIIDQELNPTPSPSASSSASPSASPSESPIVPSLTIPTNSFIDGQVGEGYRNFFYGEITNFTTLPVLSLTTTNRPPGIQMPSELCGTSSPTDRPTSTLRIECALNGTPTEAGDYLVGIQLADNFGHSISKDAPLKILPSPTPVPGTPNSCQGTCGSNYNCRGGLYCFEGFCRNPECPTDNTCGCVATPTPTPTMKPTIKPSAKNEVVYLSPRPSGTPLVGITRAPTTPSPTPIVVQQANQGFGYLLWISASTLTTAIILALFAL